jgi:hypothetical protein
MELSSKKAFFAENAYAWRLVDVFQEIALLL